MVTLIVTNLSSTGGPDPWGHRVYNVSLTAGGTDGEPYILRISVSANAPDVGQSLDAPGFVLFAEPCGEVIGKHVKLS